MQYLPLGRTGLQVSRLCMGTATFGAQADEAASHAMLDASAEQGVNFIDTANAYPLGSAPQDKGESERIVGRWLAKRRRDFVLATKGGAVMGPLPSDRGNSREHLLGAIDASLQRLGTDYVDLYQLHYDDPDTPLDESLEALDVIVRSGRARHAGLSNFQAWRVARALGRCELHGWSPPVVVQPRYNLLFRQIERELVPLCLQEGLAMICFNPLAGGLLSGKHRFEAPPAAGSRFGEIQGASLYRDRYWHAREFEAVTSFVRLAQQAGLSPVTLAIAWVLAKPGVTSTLVGASRASQLPEVLAATQTRIDADLLARLDKLSQPFRMGDASR